MAKNKTEFRPFTFSDQEFEQCLGCGYKHTSSKPIKCVKCGAQMSYHQEGANYVINKLDDILGRSEIRDHSELLAVSDACYDRAKNARGLDGLLFNTVGALFYKAYEERYLQNKAKDA